MDKYKQVLNVFGLHVNHISVHLRLAIWSCDSAISRGILLDYQGDRRQLDFFDKIVTIEVHTAHHVQL